MSADTQAVKPLDLDKLEELVNEKIQAATPVTVTVYEEGDIQLKKVSKNTGIARYPELLISLQEE
jgi:hypothetical protein